MPEPTLSLLVAVPASEAGALDGFECRCTCGLVLRSSLLAGLRADAATHLSWHERQPARGAELASTTATAGPELALRRAVVEL